MYSVHPLPLLVLIFLEAEILKIIRFLKYIIDCNACVKNMGLYGLCKQARLVETSKLSQLHLEPDIEMNGKSLLTGPP